MAATRAQLDAVLKAADFLLGARQDQTLTIEEWLDLARAVAVAKGRTTAEWLTERDLVDIERLDVAWIEAVDGPDPAAGDD